MSKLFKNKAILIGILIIALITFAPLVIIGFVTADDLCTLQMCKCGYWENAYSFAVHQGRIFFLLTSFFSYIPYFFDPILWTKIMQFLPIFFIFHGFNKVISWYFNKRKAGLLFLLIFFIFFQLTADYNIFISYHCYFTTAFASLVWGFSYYQLYFETKNKKNLYISYFLFAFGLLFYEIHIVYSFFYFSLAFTNVINEKYTLFTRFKKALYSFKGYLIIILVYIILMLSWSFFHPSNYEGNQFANNFSLTNYYNTVLKFINGALPLNNFFGSFKFFIDRSPDVEGFNPFAFIFSETLSIANYLKLFLIGILYIPFIKISKKIPFSRLYWGMLMGILLLILPALLLSLSNKYTTFQMEHYTITVFQFFGTSLFFMSIFLWIDKKMMMIYWMKILSRCLILIFLLYTSIAHDYANKMYANDLKQSQVRITFMDEFMKTDYYENIGNQTAIYAPSLWQSHSYLHEAKRLTEQGFNWRSYSKLIYNKDRDIIRDKDELIDDCKTTKDEIFYSFILKQAYQTNDFILISSKINKLQCKNDIFISDTVDVFIYSNNNFGIITYNTNTVLTDSSNRNNYNTYKIKKGNFNKKIWQHRIINKNIDIQSVNIGFMD
ncbi:MAG: hypothetical protein HXX18_03275 [Bacteroidetes bacterium]|nr:hypothetical protein [Bacteroidota bacterium]